ncbi:MAG: hypothetical protein DWQ10_09605, partial [Calditrichaeota bacterium]
MGKMKNYFRIYASFLFLFLISVEFIFAATEVKLSARLDSDEVPFNKEAKLQVIATWKGPINAIKFFPIDAPTTTNLKLIATSTANTVGSNGDTLMSTREYEFSFVGETLGMAYIDEVILRYHDADLQEHVLRSARLPLKIVDPVAEKDSNSLITVYGVLLLLLFGVISGIIFYKKKKSQTSTVVATAPVKTPEETALDALHNEVDLHTPEINSQYDEISRIVWRYLRKRFDVPESVGTTDELMQILEAQNVTMEDIAAL